MYKKRLTIKPKFNIKTAIQTILINKKNKREVLKKFSYNDKKHLLFLEKK